MYRNFFELRERPFELTPNPRYLYLTGPHREALSNLHYGIAGRKGITVLLGEAGTGKTTLLRAVIDSASGPGVRCVYLSNPVLTRAEFYEFLARKFGLSERAGASKALFVEELEELLTERLRAGVTSALVVDEAQSLPHELMEEIRLLANLETTDDKLLQVVLAGQPELAERLEHEALRQLKQRIALRCSLLPLDLRGTASYISGRITIAGGQASQIFTREAVQLIHERSRGIPRTISVICDNALVNAFAAATKPIGANIVLDVCRDFKLEAPAPEAPASEPVGRAEADAEAARNRRPASGRHAAAVAAPGNGGGARQPAVARASTPPAASPRPHPVQAPGVGPGRPADVAPVASARASGEMFTSFSKRKRRFLFF